MICPSVDPTDSAVEGVDDLRGGAEAGGDGEHQHRADAHGDGHADQPGQRLAPLAVGLVDDAAHDEVGNAVKDLGDRQDAAGRGRGDAHHADVANRKEEIAV